GAHERHERLGRNWIRRDLRTGDAALALKAVALPAAVLDEGGLALLGGSRQGDVREREGGGECRQPHAHTQRTHREPHRGCVHTSTSAGWPDFTTSTARLMVGPSSAGSLIGPADHHPMELASLA